MVTDDKVKSGDTVDVYDNVNTQDQKRAGIILLVLAALFIVGLVGLGLSHAPESTSSHNQPDASGVEGQVPQVGVPVSNFDVNHPVGSVELPGTIGQPQHFVIGKGNTPVVGAPATTAAPAETPSTAPASPASASPAESGSTPAGPTPAK